MDASQGQAATQAEKPAPGPGQTLFQFVRFWSRSWEDAGTAATPDRERGRDVQVAEAVLTCTHAGMRADADTSAATGATINAIAAELGLDQSGASRMVAQAVRHGFLTKRSAAPDAGDGRTRLVQVTDAGRTLVAEARAWQEAVFTDLTRDWTPEEIETFTQLMQRLQRQAAHAARPRPTD